MNELPPHVAALIEDARTKHNPTAVDQERVQALLIGTLGAALVTAPAASVDASTLITASASKAGGGLGLKLVLASALLAGGGGLWAFTHQAGATTETQTAANAPSLLGSPSSPRSVEPNAGPATSAFAAGAAKAQAEEVQADEAAPAPVLDEEQRRDGTRVATDRVDEHGDTVRRSHASGARRERAAVRDPARGKAEAEAAASATAATLEAAPSPSTSAAPTLEAPPRIAESELPLIRAALTALRDAQPAHALSLLETHAARFPSGVLSHERQGLRVVSLCALGRFDVGRREQAAFLRNDSESALAGRVRAACPSEGGR